MLKIETLSKMHNRADFDCDNDELNLYLQHIARQHLNKGISKTFVLIDDEQPTSIIAYMTLIACEVQANKLPESWEKKYPKQIPAVKLARLAVAVKQQRKGYGELLIIEAMNKTIEVASNLGIAGLFVDAKNQRAKTYYQQFGFISLPEKLENLFLPLATISKLLQKT
ncbi:MAG: GNAT family N-acetyltransferase [Gammaproteobacteria bacterium]|nr:GNAT family N-acetyltransferase [Gammaproteobacteria bacterium]